MTVSGKRIKTEGFFHIMLSYKGHSMKGPVIVLDRPNTVFLSAQVIDKLELVEYNEGVTGDISLQDKYPDLFSDKLGECTKTNVKLHLKPDAHSVHTPRCPVLLALEEQLSIELDRFVKNGILTFVNVSDWAAPIVAARKPNGKIRICADFSTGLNEALDANNYPIPRLKISWQSFKGILFSHN